MMGDQLRLRLCRLLCPSTHRLIEVGDVITDPLTIRGDLIRGGDALEKGWDCDPAILWNAAAHLQREYYSRRYAGQVMAECDCGQEVSCRAAGRCLARDPQ